MLQTMKMADKKTIHIPTLDEIEQFEQESVLTPIFKKKPKIDNSLQESSKVSEASHSLADVATVPVPILPQCTAGEASSKQEGTAITTASTSKSSNNILVSFKQKGNPILKHVRNVPMEFSDIVPDYELGSSVCALFLSVRYHQQHPNYIHGRLKLLGKAYDVRVILMLVDSKEPHLAIKELAHICILSDCTLILAFSAEEAARYLETYKVYENKPADVLMEKSDDNYMAKFTDCLTTIKSVNKTNCSTLLSTFGSFEKICQATAEDMSLCPGVGQQKASRLYGVLHEPFLKSHKNEAKSDFEALS